MYKRSFYLEKDKYLVSFLTIGMNGNICSAQTRVIIVVELGHDHTETCAPT